MSPFRVTLYLLAFSLCLAACGCFGGSDDTASKRRFGLKRKSDVASKGGRSKKTNSRKKGADNLDLDAMSPEGSMERDLQRLRQREQAQLKKIKSMKNDLDVGSEMVMREEEQLRDIRDRIASYDTAMQRYEMAARARPSREDYGDPSFVPASQFQDRPVRSTQVAYDAPARQNRPAAYGPAPEQASARRRSSRSARRSRPVVNEGETLIYAPSPDEQAAYSAMAAPAPYREAAPDYGHGGNQSMPPAQERYPDEYERTPSPRPQAPLPRTAAPARPTQAVERDWAPAASLFSQRSGADQRFPDPDQYQVRRGDSRSEPAPARVSLPTPPPARREPQAKAPIAATPVASPADEETFMPDMFLGGGR